MSANESHRHLDQYPPVSPRARCASLVHGGPYVCARDAGHKGRHYYPTAGITVIAVWADAFADPVPTPHAPDDR